MKNCGISGRYAIALVALFLRTKGTGSINGETDARKALLLGFRSESFPGLLGNKERVCRIDEFVTNLHTLSALAQPDELEHSQSSLSSPKHVGIEVIVPKHQHSSWRMARR